MDLMEAIKTRRSIRRYKETPVPEELLKTVLNAARLAPSANNAQPWRIIMVTDEDVKLKLAAGANNQRFIAQAPIILVACGLPDEAFQTVGGYMSSHVMDVSIALDHLTLAAHSVGLGTCWIAWFKEDKVRDQLTLSLGVSESMKRIVDNRAFFNDFSARLFLHYLRQSKKK